MKNYEGDSFTNPVTRLQKINSEKKNLNEFSILPLIDHRSMSTLKPCKLKENELNYI